MSRRRDVHDVQREYVVVDVMCSKKHLVGRVFKTLIPDDETSPAGFEPGSALRFEDFHGIPDSGRVVGQCKRCRESVILRWSRVRDRLDQLEAGSRSTGEIHP